MLSKENNLLKIIDSRNNSSNEQYIQFPSIYSHVEIIARLIDEIKINKSDENPCFMDLDIAGLIELFINNDDYYSLKIFNTNKFQTLPEEKIHVLDLKWLYEDNPISSNYWILRMSDFQNDEDYEISDSYKSVFYLKIPINITYNNIFKQVIKIIKIYKDKYERKEEIYRDYITINQITDVLKKTFKYEEIDFIDILKNDLRYRSKKIDLSDIEDKEFGSQISEAQKNDYYLSNDNNIYYDRNNGKYTFEAGYTNPKQEKIFYPEEQYKKYLQEIINTHPIDKFNDYIFTNGRILCINNTYEAHDYIGVDEEECLFLLSNDGWTEIIEKICFILETQKKQSDDLLILKDIKIFMEKVFGYKFLNPEDLIEGHIIKYNKKSTDLGTVGLKHLYQNMDYYINEMYEEGRTIENNCIKEIKELINKREVF